MTPIVKPLKDRFNDKWTPEANSGCHLWTACVNKDGYGLIHSAEGKLSPAHRIGWELKHGAIPNRLCVLHKCDVKCCVNPDHLFLGSKSDNTKDCIAKGRGFTGVRNGFAKLTNEIVLKIRSSNLGLCEIAREFGIHYGHVWRIRQRKCWTHI